MMRYIVFLLCLLTASTPGTQAAIVRTNAYLQAGTNANTNLTVMSNVYTANSTLIVIAVRSYMGGSVATLKDNINGTLTAAVSVDGVAGSGLRERIYYLYGASVGSATHSFTATTTGGGYSSIHVATYTGTLYTSDPLDQSNTGTSVGGSATASVTPSQNGELIYSVVCGNSNNVAPTAAGSPMTMINSQGFVSGGSFLGADADYVQTTAASVTASFTYVATNSVIAVATFKAAPTNNTSNFFNLLLR